MLWDVFSMKGMIVETALCEYDIYYTQEIETQFHRTIKSMIIEWYLHNIGYYLTLPLCKHQFFKSLNNRFKHVDLEEWGGKQ